MLDGTRESTAVRDQLRDLEAAARFVLTACAYLRGKDPLSAVADLEAPTETAIPVVPDGLISRVSEGVRGVHSTLETFTGAFDPATLDAGAVARVTAAPWLSLPPGFLLSVLIAVYNERGTIRELLSRVRAISLPKEVIVVDDGSTDGTREILQREVEGKLPGVHVLYHGRNRGKGAAVRTAIAHASGTVCVIQDADLEYDPQDYYQLLGPLLDGRADAVYGSRFLGGGVHRVHLYWHALGNKLLTSLSNMLTNLNLTDMETCYKAVRTELLRSLPLCSRGFDIEPELTALLARSSARIYEVPISYSGRDYSEGKKINWTDGVQAIFCIIRSRLRRL